MSPVKERNNHKNKSTSLKELGFKIEPLKKQSEDEKGNQFVYRVRGPEPVYYIMRTARGKLKAFRSMEDPANQLDVTIMGLYDFQEDDDDLVGRRDSGPQLQSRGGRQHNTNSHDGKDKIHVKVRGKDNESESEEAESRDNSRDNRQDEEAA